MSLETKEASQNARGHYTERKYQRKKLKFLYQPWMVQFSQFLFQLNDLNFLLHLGVYLGA